MLVYSHWARSNPGSDLSRFQRQIYLAILFVGVCCWSSFLARSVIRLSAASDSLASQQPAATTTESGLAEVDLDEVEDGFTATVEMDQQLPDPLELESTVITHSGRVAVICGEQLEEGQAANVKGKSVRLDSVSPRSANVTVDGTPVRLSMVTRLTSDSPVENSQNFE